MVGPHWSKGWIIEDCEISDSRCSGISLGKYLQPNNENKWTTKILQGRYADGERRYLPGADRGLWTKWPVGLKGDPHTKYRALAEALHMIIVGDVPVGKSRFEVALRAKGFTFIQRARRDRPRRRLQLRPAPPERLRPAGVLKYLPPLLTKKLTPDQLREKLNEAVGFMTKLPKRKIRPSSTGSGKPPCWPDRRASTWCRCTATNAATSAPLSSIHPHRRRRRQRRTAPALRWRPSEPSGRLSGMPGDYKLAVRQRTHTLATPVWRRRAFGLRPAAGAGRRHQR